MSIIRDLHAPLPPSVDLRPQCPPIFDQMDIGSCTSNAIAAALEFDQLKQGLPSYIPSRLYIYWNERFLEDSTDYDSGAELRNGFKSLTKWGYCSESMWPYNPVVFAQKPPLPCYTAGQPQCGVTYAALYQELDQLKGALANGVPFVFGFTVYSSFESTQVATTGKIPMPHPSEGVLGGHAVVCVGYSTDSDCFICRNSWGANWGDQGHFYMPEEYMLDQNLCADFWVISHVLG